ncbi:hypothetical protein TNCV_3637841 [Trichonephila clavipes]|nr:hypothetical protein TNCV_3637841 [Trichonephila clavipes]
MTSHRCLVGFRSGECDGQKRMSNPVWRYEFAVRHYLAGIPYWMRPATRTEQQTPRLVTGLRLSEMDWFVAFSWSPPYPSTSVIPPRTETRFMRE